MVAKSAEDGGTLPASLGEQLADCDDRLLADIGVLRTEGVVTRRAGGFALAARKMLDAGSSCATTPGGCGASADAWARRSFLKRLSRRVDPVLAALALLLVVLAAIDSAQATATLAFTASSLGDTLPYILLSAAFAAAISASGADQPIGRIFRARPAAAIAMAALFGAAAPLCSLSVIPLIGALLAAGVPLAAVMAFWIASPLMDPESFILTSAIIGIDFALARTVIAIALGLLAGFATMAVSTAAFRQPLAARPRATATSVWSACNLPPTADGSIVWRFWREPLRRRAFLRQGAAIAWFLTRWLALAFALERLMAAYLPAGLVTAWVGGGQWWAIPASVAVGMPAYINGYAALPLLSGLLDKGMQPGAAMAFLVAGEIASLPSALAVYVLVNRTVFGWYLLLGAAGSLLAGYVYQAALAL